MRAMSTTTAKRRATRAQCRRRRRRRGAFSTATTAEAPGGQLNIDDDDGGDMRAISTTTMAKRRAAHACKIYDDDMRAVSTTMRKMRKRKGVGSGYRRGPASAPEQTPHTLPSPALRCSIGVPQAVWLRRQTRAKVENHDQIRLTSTNIVSYLRPNNWTISVGLGLNLVWSTLAQFRAKPADGCACPIRSNLTCAGASSAEFGPDSSSCGRCRPELARCRPAFQDFARPSATRATRRNALRRAFLRASGTWPGGGGVTLCRAAMSGGSYEAGPKSAQLEFGSL